MGKSRSDYVAKTPASRYWFVTLVSVSHLRIYRWSSSASTVPTRREITTWEALALVCQSHAGLLNSIVARSCSRTSQGRVERLSCVWLSTFVRRFHFSQEFIRLASTLHQRNLCQLSISGYHF